MAKDTNINVRSSEGTKNRLSDLAEKLGKSQADVIALSLELLDDVLDSKEIANTDETKIVFAKLILNKVKRK
jgi:predicted DNA-binding protein